MGNADPTCRTRPVPLWTMRPLLPIWPVRSEKNQPSRSSRASPSASAAVSVCWATTRALDSSNIVAIYHCPLSSDIVVVALTRDALIVEGPVHTAAAVGSARHARRWRRWRQGRRRVARWVVAFRLPALEPFGAPVTARAAVPSVILIVGVRRALVIVRRLFRCGRLGSARATRGEERKRRRRRSPPNRH